MVFERVENHRAWPACPPSDLARHELQRRLPVALSLDYGIVSFGGVGLGEWFGFAFAFDPNEFRG
jgi:hypothetical protein